MNFLSNAVLTQSDRRRIICHSIQHEVTLNNTQKFGSCYTQSEVCLRYKGQPLLLFDQVISYKCRFHYLRNNKYYYYNYYYHHQQQYQQQCAMSIHRTKSWFVLNKIYRKYKFHGENYSAVPTMHEIYCRKAVNMAQLKSGLTCHTSRKETYESCGEILRT